MSPRPPQPRTIGAEDRMRVNVLRWLETEDRNIPWLARKMTESGCHIGQASLWKSLRQDRKILVNEAVAISAVLGVSITDLTSEQTGAPPPLAVTAGRG